MRFLTVIISMLLALTSITLADSDPKRIASILEGSILCNATEDPVACMTGFMAALDASSTDVVTK